MWKNIINWWNNTIQDKLQEQLNMIADELNDRQHCIILLSLFPVEQFNQFIIPEDDFTYITSYYENITAYTKQLKVINFHLQYERAIPKELLVDNKEAILLQHFLSVSDGYYCDQIEAINKFYHQVTLFCQHLEKGETTAVGEMHYNFIVMRNILINIYGIVDTLVAINKQ